MPVFQFSQYRYGLSALPHGAVTVSEKAQLLARFVGQFDPLLQRGDRFLLMPLFQIGQAQEATSYSKVQIELDGLLELFNGRIEIALYDADISDVYADDGRKRIELLRALDFRHRFVKPPEHAEMGAVPMVSGRITRVEFDRAFEFFFSFSELPRMLIDVSE